MSIENIEYRNHTIKVSFDDDPLNPREWEENFGTMVCQHKRYLLGDVEFTRDLDLKSHYFDSWEEVEGLLVKQEEAVLILPLALYDHGGITMSVGTSMGCSFDSGQVGFIFVTRKKILETFGRKRLSKKLLVRAEQCLRDEVKRYDCYLTGQVFGYQIEGPDCDDSCWGYYDQEGMVTEAKLQIDHSIRQEELPGLELPR